MADRLQLPVRFLWGESGFGRRGDGPKIEDRIAGASFRVIAGTTHFVPMEKPEAVVSEALEFFREDAV